jgi:hypothetical protein
MEDLLCPPTEFLDLGEITGNARLCIRRNILGESRLGLEDGINTIPATGGRRAKITPTPFDSLLPPGAGVGFPVPPVARSFMPGSALQCD